MHHNLLFHRSIVWFVRAIIDHISTLNDSHWFNSLRISGDIWKWFCTFTSSLRAFFWSASRDSLYRCAKTNSAVCHRMGRRRVSEVNATKWSTSAHTTRRGNEYFLFISTRMNIDVDPEYGIWSRRRSAAEEWIACTDARASTLPKIADSRREQVIDWASGNSMPL